MCLKGGLSKIVIQKQIYLLLHLRRSLAAMFPYQRVEAQHGLRRFGRVEEADDRFTGNGRALPGKLCTSRSIRYHNNSPAVRQLGVAKIILPKTSCIGMRPSPF